MFIDFLSFKERAIRSQSDLAADTLRNAGSKSGTDRMLISAGQYQGLQLAIDIAQQLVDEANKKHGDKA